MSGVRPLAAVVGEAAVAAAAGSVVRVAAVVHPGLRVGVVVVVAAVAAGASKVAVNCARLPIWQAGVFRVPSESFS